MLRKAYTAAVPCHPHTAEACFGTRRRGIITSLRIGRVARELWTLKTAVHLAAITGYSDRACEAWISPTAPTVIPGDALAALIRCEFGQRFLAAIMEDAAPRWWTFVQSAIALFTSRARQDQAQAELEAAVHADDDIRAAIARSEAAMLLSSSNADRRRNPSRSNADHVCVRAVAGAAVGRTQ